VQSFLTGDIWLTASPMNCQMTSNRDHCGWVFVFIAALMDPEYAPYYAKEVTVILIRERIVSKVVKQRAATEGLTLAYIKHDVLLDFFKAFLDVPNDTGSTRLPPNRRNQR
jgi:hypothetical protein